MSNLKELNLDKTVVNTNLDLDYSSQSNIEMTQEQFYKKIDLILRKGVEDGSSKDYITDFILQLGKQHPEHGQHLSIALQMLKQITYPDVKPPIKNDLSEDEVRYLISKEMVEPFWQDNQHLAQQRGQWVTIKKIPVQSSLKPPLFSDIWGAKGKCVWHNTYNLTKQKRMDPPTPTHDQDPEYQIQKSQETKIESTDAFRFFTGRNLEGGDVWFCTNPATGRTHSGRKR